jgi:hypothetical protein
MRLTAIGNQRSRRQVLHSCRSDYTVAVATSARSERSSKAHRVVLETGPATDTIWMEAEVDTHCSGAGVRRDNDAIRLQKQVNALRAA